MTRPHAMGEPAQRVVFGASAYNDHVQQMARALYDANRLACYVTGTVDVWPTLLGRLLRRALAAAPELDRQLSRRAISSVPASVVRPRWGWDLARTVALGAGLGLRMQDWCWERAERSIDARTARLLARRDVGAYLGVEFGALASLQAARRLGKPGLVAFLSPHHATRAQWVDPELARFEVQASDAERRLRQLAVRRDAERDQELALADGVVSGSSFTTRSLVAAGVAESRILTVPLGGPSTVNDRDLPDRPAQTATVVYAGALALHKGVHHLLEAWSHLAPTGAQLHLYGQDRLPRAVVDRAKAGSARDSIVFHGSVPGHELRRVYRSASVLVLPTLADGFGQVVADALAEGLPVITTTNAGAADRIIHGQNGFVIPPADVAQLAATLDRCLTNREELFLMRRAALATARQWTWAHFRRAFAAGVDDMLADPHRPAVARIA